MTNQEVTGNLRKMRVEHDTPVRYRLPLIRQEADQRVDQEVELNPLIGQPLTLHFSGRIQCINCGRDTKKSFNQGYCYPCFRKLAECDMCIMKPETCHFHLGTCRDEDWAQSHCMQSHYVYIANSSGLKVGITRGNQLPTRWIDQGALQAMAVFKVQNRFHSGLLENSIKSHVTDRTDWRKMLKGGEVLDDFQSQAKQLIDQARAELENLRDSNTDSGALALDWQELDPEEITIEYPVTDYPLKVTSFNADKIPEVSGTLNGIKGQYLIFDSGVINMRKYAGYEVTLRV